MPWVVRRSLRRVCSTLAHAVGGEDVALVLVLAEGERKRAARPGRSSTKVVPGRRTLSEDSPTQS